MKKGSFLLWIGIAALAVVLAYTGYLFWQSSAKASELKVLEKSISDYNNQVLQNDHKQVLKAINAKKTLNSLVADLIEWSKVIKKIRSTIPLKKGIPLVEVLSYNSSNEGSFSISVKTVAGRSEPYLDVADLIQAFNESGNFKNAFVPSISAGEDEEGSLILTFVMTVDYVEEKPLEEELSEILDESLETETEEAVKSSDDSAVLR